MVHKFSVPVNACIYDRLRWLEGQVDANGTILKNGTNESLQIASIQKDFLIKIRYMLHNFNCITSDFFLFFHFKNSPIF